MSTSPCGFNKDSKREIELTDVLVADKFPSAACQGVDLSPIQPPWVPPNIQFVVDNFELPWTHKEDFFDYIHVRHTLPFVKDRPRLFAQAFA